MGASGDLRNRVAQGVAWSLAEKVGSMFLQLGVSILVARLLAPEDYGVMALLTVFATLALVVVDSGFSQTLIRSEAPTREEYRSVFGFNLFMALLLYGIMVLLSPVAARFFGVPILTRLAPVLFLLLPLNALCVIQQALCARNFRFDLLSKAIFLSSLLSGGVAVGMALAGCGVWSLVGQRLMAMGAKAALLWAWSDWRPRGSFSGKALRRMAPYSLRLLLTDLISAIYNNVSQLFVGKIYSTQMLGYFNQGQKLKDVPVLAAQQSVQNVTFPALAKLKEEPEKFAESYRQLMMMTSFLLFPVLLGMVALAPDMFALLLGEKWMPTVPYFRILTLSGLFVPLSSIAYNVLKARSNGRVIVRLEVVKKGIMTLILALTIPRGVEAIAWGVVAMAAVEWMLNLWAAGRYSTLSIGRVFSALALPLLVSGLMAAAVNAFARGVECSLALRLCGEILLGVLCYGGWALLCRPEPVRVAREVWRSSRNKQDK